MDYKIILKYLENRATREERESVECWINASDANRSAFNRYKNMWVLSNLPKGKASAEDVSSFRARLRRRIFFKKAAWYSMSAAAAVALLFFVMNRFNTYEERLQYIKGQYPAFVEYKTNKGTKGVVKLPDGSTIWLNSDSYVKSPAVFDGKTRSIDFVGEGYFDVKPNAKIPMEINLKNDLKVVVKGTQFNLKSYKDESQVSALLVKGKIEIIRVGVQGGLRREVQPNQHIEVNENSIKLLTASRPSTFNTLAWRDGWLVFDETPMNEVIKKMERWYGVRFIVEDERLLRHRFTGKFKEESINQILDVMEAISLFRYTMKDSLVTIR